MDEEEPQFLSVRQFADKVGISSDAIYHAIYRGTLKSLSSPADRKGRRVHLIPIAEVEEYPRRRQTWKGLSADVDPDRGTERGRHQIELAAARM